MTRNTKTRKLTFMAAMLALTIFLDLSPLGAIPVGAVSATIVQMPTILTGILYGPLYGMIMGLLMGITSLLHALTRPVTPLDPLFINPLVSVLPRMLIGLFAGLAFLLLVKLFKNKMRFIAATVAGAVGALTNTVFVLGALYFIYAEKIILDIGLQDSAALKTLIWGIVTTNGVAEMLVCAGLAGGITLAVDKMRKA